MHKVLIFQVSPVKDSKCKLHDHASYWKRSSAWRWSSLGVSLWDDKALKKGLSHLYCFLIHTAPLETPSPIFAFLQVAYPGNKYGNVCLNVMCWGTELQNETTMNSNAHFKWINVVKTKQKKRTNLCQKQTNIFRHNKLFT